MGTRKITTYLRSARARSTRAIGIITLKGENMQIEIGKRYNIKTRYATYINYKTKDFVNDSLKITSIDGDYKLHKDDIIDVKKLSFTESIKVIPKRLVELK